MTSLLHLRLLGAFAARAGGRPLVITGRKDRALVAYLALNAPERIGRRRLAELLWSDVAGDPRQSLRQSLANITRALAAAHRPALRSLAIRREDVALERATVDSIELTTLAASEDPRDLESASGLLGGTLLEDCGGLAPAFDDWLTRERERVASVAASVLRRLIDLHSVAGRITEAITAATRLANIDPYREDIRRELMLLYAESGRNHSALAQYEAFARLLRAEIGAEPDQATRDLARLLREGSMPPAPEPGTLPARTRTTRRTPPAAGFLELSVTVLEQIPDCVIVTDLEGHIVGWNRWSRASFGYERREVLGRKPFFLYGPDANESLTTDLIAKSIRYGRWSGVLRLFNKDGSSRLHKRTMLPLRDPGGTIVGVFGVTRPLTRPVPGL